MPMLMTSSSKALNVTNFHKKLKVFCYVSRKKLRHEQTNVGDEQVNDIGRFSADFCIKVKTTGLNTTLLYNRLQ